MHANDNYRSIAQLITDFVYTAKMTAPGQYSVDWIAPEFHERYGYTLNDLGDRDLVEHCCHPDDRTAAAEWLAAVRSGRTEARELRLVTKGGEARCVRVVGQPFSEETDAPNLPGQLGASGRPAQLDASGEPDQPGRANTPARGMRIAAVPVSSGERRAAELDRDLRQRVEELEAVFELSPVPIIVARDVEFSEVLGNPAAAVMLGLPGAMNPSRHGAGHKQLPFQVFRDGRELTFDELPMRVAALQGVALRDVEVEVRLPDGSARTMLECALPLYGDDGAVRGSLGVFVDITESKRAQAALREREELYRAVFVRNNAVKLLIDPADGRIVDANPAAAEFYGYPRERLIAMRIQDINQLPPDAIRVEMDRAVSEERTFFVFPHRLASGEVRTVEVHTGPIHVGRHTLLCSIVHDVTERERAETALRASEARYRQLVQFSPDMVLVCQDDRVALLNPAGAALLGAARAEEVVGRSVWDLVPLADRPWVQTLWSGTAGRLSAPLSRDQRLVRLDGAEVDVEIIAVPFTHQGRAATLIVARDVTARRHAERDKTELQQQLMQAQKLQAVGQLASGVAHDVNNLLTAVLGYADLARNALTRAHPARRELSHIEEAAREATSVTRGLLTFCGRTATDVHPVSIPDVVRASVRLLRRLLPATTELASRRVGAAPLWVLGDPTQLQQVIMNLVINARDALPHGGRVQIVMSHTVVRPLALDGSAGPLPHVRITVSDNGVGMTHAVQERIFEPFFTTKPLGQGAGLGLSIVHGIIAAHSGEVRVRSRLGRGTTFTILLPAVLPTDSGALTAAQESAPVGKGELILVAESHRVVRELIAAALRAARYEVVVAEDGPMAERVLTENRRRVNLCVLDADLPRRDGLDLLRSWRAEGLTAPVLLVTAKPEAVPDWAREPAAALLPKPFRLAELTRQVATLLGTVPEES